MRRPTEFSDIIGHEWLVSYLKTHLENDTVPQFLILEGPEGLGKTSLADLLAINLVYGSDYSREREAAIHSVIENNGSNDYIKRYKCSVDGGRDVAKDILTEMTQGFMLNHKKVIICDECHGFVDSAQDVFLSETEFMKKDVYLIMLTTDVQKLKASLVSRAVKLHLFPLKQADMLRILRREVAERNLTIQNEQATLTLICEWSEYKPRTALSMLNAFSDGESISSNTIRDMIGVLDVMDIVPLLESLSASMTFGLNYIADMKIDDSIVMLVAECFKIKTGNPSYKVQFNQIADIRQRLQEVTAEQLTAFLYGITKTPHVSRSGLINAYISAHRSMPLLKEKDTSYMLQQELEQKADANDTLIQTDAAVQAPTVEDLLANADLVD